MTYKQLAQKINSLSPDQQEMDVTVFARGINEFLPAFDALLVNDENDDMGDILDDGHPYLQILSSINLSQ